MQLDIGQSSVEGSMRMGRVPGLAEKFHVQKPLAAVYLAFPCFLDRISMVHLRRRRSPGD